MQKIVDAFKLALKKHDGQLRKDGTTPYIVHPFRVFMILADKATVYDENVLAAAFLHDVIEDTDTDYDDVKKQFGNEVADIVSVLTKDMRLPEEEREDEYNRRLAASNWQAKVVKLADIYDNVCDMENRNLSETRLVQKLKEKQEQIRFVINGLSEEHQSFVKMVKYKVERTLADSKGKRARK